MTADVKPCIPFIGATPLVEEVNSGGHLTGVVEAKLRKLFSHYFQYATPWYKTPDFDVVDVASLNAVIISNPVATLGVPLLVRNPDFIAKIYATEATAKLGQLMMEELVALHRELSHVYGRSLKSTFPPWLRPELSAALPAEVRDWVA